ncbi:MAG TPA: ABC transporter substrate-binding protein [Amycolatopsis sp.]|nr:ABC transporter substrate-binding protein [Amycolatopsis sp.]
MASNDALPRLFPRHFRHTTTALGVAAVLTVALTACGGGSGSGGGSDTIQLGAEASLTGPGAAVGGPQTNGIQMAVDEINAAGGVKIGGKSVKLGLQTLDDQSRATLAVQNVQKMLQGGGSHYIVGTLSSSSVGAYLPIIKDRDDVISMVSGAVLPGITDNKPVYRFQTETKQLDDGTGNVLLSKGAKKVAMLTDKSHASYVGNTDSFVRKLGAAGISVATQQQYQFGDTQYGAQVEAMLRTAPDALLFRGYATDLIRAITTARQLGFTGPIVSSAGYTDQEVTDANAAPVMHDVTDVGSPPVDYVASAAGGFDATLTANAKKFADDYQARFHQAPGLLSANGYESVYLLAGAWAKAGSATDIPKVRTALDGLKPADVTANAVLPVSGNTVFANHQTIFALVGLTYGNGHWAPSGKVDSTLGPA